MNILPDLESRAGLLFNEFDQIFNDIFGKRSDIYKRIVQSLADDQSTYENIYQKLEKEKGGTTSEYLDELVKSGFIHRDYTWQLKNGKLSKLSHYRINDNYLRFYLKYIDSNKEKIMRGDFIEQSLVLLPAFDSIMGLQFENMVINNRKTLLQILQVKPEEVVYDNPFFQRKTTRQEGCQIDYLIQTRFDTLYICEIKFSKYLISASVITEVQEKIRRLKVPRHISRRPVLIHINGVSEESIANQYFSAIIDFSQLLA